MKSARRTLSDECDIHQIQILVPPIERRHALDAPIARKADEYLSASHASTHTGVFDHAVRPRRADRGIRLGDSSLQ